LEPQWDLHRDDSLRDHRSEQKLKRTEQRLRKSRCAEPRAIKNTAQAFDASGSTAAVAISLSATEQKALVSIAKTGQHADEHSVNSKVVHIHSDRD
jgi:hypothetical protein